MLRPFSFRMQSHELGVDLHMLPVQFHIFAMKLPLSFTVHVRSAGVSPSLALHL
jgi:hypothetical protein